MRTLAATRRHQAQAADFLTGEMPFDVPASAGALSFSFPEERMKRIDKPVTPQIEDTRHEAATAVAAQAENMQAAWTDAWNQQLGRSGEVYGRLFAGMRDELTAFWQKRLEANMETMRAWSTCGSVNEAVELQQSWLRSAIAHYSDEGSRISDLCRGAIFHAEPATAQQSQEEVRTKPEAQAPHIQRAAE